jgi:chaperonin GroES
MKMPSIEPIGDRVVVKQDKPEEVSSGGIAIPDKVRESPRFGTVIARGPGAFRFISGVTCPANERFPMQVQVGDRVLLPHQGDMVLLDPADKDSKVVVLQESQLLAILR